MVRSTCIVRGACCVLFAALIVLAAQPQSVDGRQSKEPPVQPKENPAPDANEAARLRLPPKEFFAQVQDKRPVASVGENFGEFLAYNYVIQFVKTQPSELLARHAKRNVGYAELIHEDHADLLRQLLHFEGKLVRLRQIDAAFLGDPQQKMLYEGWIAHEGETEHLVCVVFAEAPQGLTVGAKIALDGYYFKLLGYMSRDVGGREVVRIAPLVIGRTPSIIEFVPEPPSPVELPKTGVNYRAIIDGTRLDPKAHPEEWGVYKRIIAHTSKVPLSEMQHRALQDVLYRGLIGEQRIEKYARNLIQVRGRLLSLRKIELRGDYLFPNLKELYEGWIHHYDHGPNTPAPIKIVITELPDDFELGDEVDEAVEVNGYYFKYADMTGEEMPEPRTQYAPIVIGRSFRLIETAPAPVNLQLNEKEQLALPGGDYFGQVMDKRPLASRSENYVEFLRYTFVFNKIMQFSPEVLARNSRRDVVYADLINDIRSEYLRKLLHVEGKLVRIRQRDARNLLKIDGVEYVYEGWIYHENEPQHPIVVAFTELPEGMETGERIAHQVSVDGYYFKLMAYESQEKDQQGKRVWRVAPLLVARKPIVHRDPRDQYPWDGFIPLVIGLVSVVAVAALVLTLWFRRGDRLTRMRVRETMLTNPFDGTPEPPVQAGPAWNEGDETAS